MGDSSETRQQVQILRNDEDYVHCRFLLDGAGINADLELNKFNMRWISDDADCFVSHTRGNESIKNVSLYPFSLDDGNDGDAGNYEIPGTK
jgi:hypothetical protein